MERIEGRDVPVVKAADFFQQRGLPGGHEQPSACVIEEHEPAPEPFPTLQDKPHLSAEGPKLELELHYQNINQEIQPHVRLQLLSGENSMGSAAQLDRLGSLLNFIVICCESGGTSRQAAAASRKAGPELYTNILNKLLQHQLLNCTDLGRNTSDGADPSTWSSLPDQAKALCTSLTRNGRPGL